MACWKRGPIWDVIAFWIFGLANNFAYVIMLTAAEDIIAKQEAKSEQPHGSGNSSDSKPLCYENLGQPRCKQMMSTGAILLADILPALCIKFTFPFFMNRIPFGFRHFLVCSLQTSSYLIVAFSPNIQISIIGIVFASVSSGLGELCYLALSSHYAESSIAAWSSGTGGAGLIGSFAYALLTDPKVFALYPRDAILSMLIVPVIFAITYWFILSPSPTVHRMKLLIPSTWIVPTVKKEAITATSLTAKSARTFSSSSRSNRIIPANGECQTSNSFPSETSIGNTVSAQFDGEQSPPAEMKMAVTNEFSFAYKLRLVLPLLRYMIPLSIVYFAEYLINSGLHQLIHFDCDHGFGMDNPSQFRWYQALYQFGVFTSRSSVFCFVLPRFGLYLLPILQCLNLVLFFFQSLYHFIPHIIFIFLLIYVEGLFGGASYVNTFHRIHHEANSNVR